MDTENTPRKPWIDDGEQSFSLLAQHVDDFCRGWDESESPPSIADFLPDDKVLRHLALPVLRHRVLCNYFAESDNMSVDDVLSAMLEKVDG